MNQDVMVEGLGAGTIWGYDREAKEYTIITSKGTKKEVKEELIKSHEYEGQGIYFVNEQHEKNYARTLRRWPLATKDTEYQAACYILSVPMIYHKVEHLINVFEKPVDWIWRYLKWDEEYNEDWETYRKYRDDDKLHPDYEAWIDRKPFDLTGSMINLGRFSLNLWNSSNESNLMNCIGSLDNHHFNVLKCAIDMRMGKYRGR
jgi:hypothetical protein